MTRLPLASVPAYYAALRPDADCLIQDDQRWSWRDLDDRSSAWAEDLRRHGVKRNAFVAFALPNSCEFFALTFGIYKLGATPAPLSPRLPESELQDILGLLRPSAFVDESGIDGVGGDGGGEVCEDGWPVASSWKACTSGGSTGRPKVIVDRRPAAFDVDADFLDLPRDQAIIVPGPLYHNAPFSAAVLALARGNCVVTMARFDSEELLRLVERWRISWAMMVPTMMHRIMRLADEARARFDVASLKTVVHTAAPMPAWLKEQWIDWLGPDRIWEVYGATEGLVRTWIGGREWLQRPGSVGRPTGGARIRILDEAGNPLPAGRVGEVFAMPPEGPQSSYRYIGAERRLACDGWESVGDIGWVDEEGYLYLADRRADLIISGGVNIYPAEVEAALLQHPSVMSCAVVGLPDEDWGQRVHAVVESQDPALDLEGLRAFLASRLASSKHPRSIEVRREPVRDDAGKVRRSQLAAQGS